jgi:hypothetical protein
VLDEWMNEVGEGVKGELYIGGEVIGEGYIGRGEVTAERYVANPNREGERMYRTGDVVRYGAGGAIEYLGRTDHQVKYHGYRVELSEIRSALNAHPRITNSVVLLRDDGQGDKVMLAYYVSEHALEAKMLRAFLSERLISATIPGLFAHIEQIPLTMNGKINYDALPGLSEARDKLKRKQEAPRNQTEEILAGVWAEVLGIEGVGIHEKFYDLGGHSLLATRVVSRVRATFNVKLSLRSLLEGGTVAKLAEKIDATRRAERGSPTPPLRPAPRQGESPLSFAQQRLWFFDQLEPGSSTYNTPTALCLEGRLNVMTLEQSLGEVMRRHEALRTTFSAAKGRPFQTIAPATRAGLPVVDLSGLRAAEAETLMSQLATDEARRPFDLARGPLLRGTLLRLEQRRHVALLTVHHIVSDGWSVELLVREVTSLHGAFMPGEPSDLPDLPIQYADFAYWQRQWLQGETLDQQLAYWIKQMSNAPAKLNLPSDRRPLPAQTYRSATVPRALSPELSSALNALSRREQVTLFMTLLAAFKVVLHHYSGQDHIVVGTAVANRNQVEVERLIGFFVNLLPLHTDISGDPTFKQLLARVREVLFGAYAHQEVPFEALVEALNPDRSQGRTPLVQATMVLQNLDEERLELTGLKVKEFNVGTGVAKFDWLLTLQEGERGLTGTLEYNTDLFDKGTVTQALAHFETVLETAASRPDTKLSEFLEVIKSADKQRQVETARALKAARFGKFDRIKQKAAIDTPLDVGRFRQSSELSWD